MIPTNNETYLFQVYKRVENSPYVYEDYPSFQFKGRPASNIEKKKYRVQKGVNGNTDSIYILSSNLFEELNPGDRVLGFGKIWEVQSTGYYFDSSYILNGQIMSEEYIASRCPKGVNLQ